jgi:hypothetical protein
LGEVGQEVAQAFTLVAMTMEATTAANFAMFTRPSFIVFSPAFPVAVALLWPFLEAPRLALEIPDGKSAHECIPRDRSFNLETTWTQFW